MGNSTCMEFSCTWGVQTLSKHMNPMHESKGNGRKTVLNRCLNGCNLFGGGIKGRACNFKARISLRWGRQLYRGRQHTILPNFPKNCMKLKEFGPPGGCASLVPPLGPPLHSAIFTTCKRSLRRLCFYRCLSVHRGCAWQGGMHGRGACMVGGVHDRGHAWQGMHVAGGMHGRGCGGGMHGRGHAW